MPSRFLLLSLLLIGSVGHAQPTPSEDTCAELLAKKLRTDLGLPMHRFDQSPDEGWRVLGDRSCHGEAADLIQKYRTVHPDAHPIVRWHQAQMEAFAGRTASAVANALATLREPGEDAQSPFRWNPYVLGTVAFLQQDLKALAAQREELARAATADPMNRPNARVLDRLSACFGKPYQEAYSCNP